MTNTTSTQPQGCDYCAQQGRYWWREEWRYVDLIGSASAGLQVGRCPKCGTYYIFGDENLGRPGFVQPDDIQALLEKVKAYESSRGN